ncbi:MAG: nucleotidyltransferase family protein [Clostridia bacterium]|nr:nucleotidyltransferase family protein [Clostridia bacterium]MBQ7046678.1 nucleotidyltransferase family protein [Oscillospiraceae bacterium]
MDNKYQENKIILELSKPQNFDKSAVVSAFSKPLDLPYILGQLLFNRVGGNAYHALRDCELLPRINREFRNPLKMIYESSVARTESFLKAEEMLSEIFVDADFPYALLKGALLSQIYPIGLRTSNDFDILINQQDVQRITDLLIANGFKQGFLRNDNFTPATRSDIIFAKMNKGETVPFVKRIDLPHMPWLEVDVNFSLDFKAKQETDVVKDFLSRTEKSIKLKNGALPTLSHSDFLIHLCAHLYKEATTLHWVNVQRDLSLYKFSDIFLLLDLYLDESFVNDLVETIFKYDLKDECYYTFYYTRELFDISNPLLDTLIEQIKPEDEEVIKQVYDPAQKKTYKFDINYIEYLFNSNRLSCLKEV